MARDTEHLRRLWVQSVKPQGENGHEHLWCVRKALRGFAEYPASPKLLPLYNDNVEECRRG